MLMEESWPGPIIFELINNCRVTSGECPHFDPILQRKVVARVYAVWMDIPPFLAQRVFKVSLMVLVGCMYKSSSF